VEKAVATDRKVDECRLDGWFEVDDSPFVNVACVAFETDAFDVKLFEDSILDDGDTAFLGLKHVDQHFLLHAVSFRDLRRLIGVVVRFGIRSSTVGPFS